MNLLKQVTLLFFWKSLEWTRFLRTNFLMYMTLAQRTREDVKYFKVKLYIFFSNYLEYYLVSSGSNLRNLLLDTFIYHHYFHLGQSIQECTKIYLVHSWIHSPITPATEILEYYGGEIILQRVFVAQGLNFIVKHSPGFTLNKFVWFSIRKNVGRKLKFGKHFLFYSGDNLCNIGRWSYCLWI